MPKTKPNISIVIPAYNEEKYIEQTLKSLKKQTVPYLELIVVDNNSTDKTAQLAKKYGASVVTEKQQGYVFSLNAGLRKAKGEIVAVTDADSEPAPNWIETLEKIFADKSVVGVSGELVFRTKNKLTGALIRNAFAGFVKFNFLIGKPHISGCNLAMRNSVLKKINGVDTRYRVSADVDMGMRLKEHGKVIYSPELLVINSLRRWEKDKLKAFSIYAKAYIFSIWLRRSPTNELKTIR